MSDVIERWDTQLVLTEHRGISWVRNTFISGEMYCVGCPSHKRKSVSILDSLVHHLTFLVHPSSCHHGEDADRWETSYPLTSAFLSQLQKPTLVLPGRLPWTQWMTWLFITKRKLIAVQTQDSLCPMSFFSSRSRQLWVYFLLVKTTGRWLHPRPGSTEVLLRKLETIEDFQMLSDEWVCLPVSDIGLPKRHTWDWSHANFPRSCQEWRNLSWVLAHIQRRFISNDSTTLWLFQEFITNHTHWGQHGFVQNFQVFGHCSLCALVGHLH